MKTVGIISQSPTLTTGFGLTTSFIAAGLTKDNYNVVCFGIDQVGETFNRNDYNYKIWAVGNTDLFKAIQLFVETENPDVIIINFDVVNLGRYYQIIRKIGFTKKLIAHLVLDGTPFLYGNLNFLNDFMSVIVPTQHSLRYLTKEHGLNNVIYMPHGVDNDYFIPLKNKNVLKENSYFSDKIIIGCFGRNTERKQQPKVLEAIKILRNKYNLKNVICYLHCDPIDTLVSWNLLDIAKYYNIEDIVYYKANKKTNDDYLTAFSKLTLPEKMGLCDLCINIPFCGGFELHNIEVQSCGVPLLTTNDYGNIAEIVSESAILLDAEHIGIWRTGAKQYFVSAELIAEKINHLLNNKDLYNQLSLKGIENAKKFKWNNLQKEIVDLIR